MGPYASLLVLIRPFESSWVLMHLCASLMVLMGFYSSLFVLMDFNVSLWSFQAFIRFYVSVCIFEGPSVPLWILIGSYWSL